MYPQKWEGGALIKVSISIENFTTLDFIPFIVGELVFIKLKM